MTDAEDDGASEGADITALILDDHDTFRRGFAALDVLAGPDTDAEKLEAELMAVWGPLADLLDVHAVAEEQIFYPNLLRKGAEGEASTRRWTPWATTTRSATPSTPPRCTDRAAPTGGSSSARPGRRTPNTWPRRRTRGWR